MFDNNVPQFAGDRWRLYALKAAGANSGSADSRVTAGQQYFNQAGSPEELRGLLKETGLGAQRQKLSAAREAYEVQQGLIYANELNARSRDSATFSREALELLKRH